VRLSRPLQAYLSRPLKSGLTQQEVFEELAPKEFKVTLKDADKIDVEERAGNRDNLEDLDCLMLRKVQDTC
jgi:hypothetical protein